jgi:hypothetical protein
MADELRATSSRAPSPCPFLRVPPDVDPVACDIVPDEVTLAAIGLVVGAKAAR